MSVKQEDAALNHADESMAIAADHPIVTERAMYWTFGGEWLEAHVSAGLTAPGLRWAVAGGRLGGARNHQTYVLVASPASNAQASALRVRYVPEAGGPPVERTYTLAPGHRLSLRANDVSGLTDGNFGVIVESSNSMPVYVEQSTYWDADGVIWAAGTNVVGTRLP